VSFGDQFLLSLDRPEPVNHLGWSTDLAALFHTQTDDPLRRRCAPTRGTM